VTHVREAGLADVEQVARLEADCLGEDAWSEWLIREGIGGSLPTVRYLVAEQADTVVGHAVASMAGDVAELQRIAVDQHCRLSGVASALLEGVLEVARHTEAERLLLEVREDNQGALAFYAQRGFLEIARRRRYYADGTTAVVLQLETGQGGGPHDT